MKKFLFLLLLVAIVFSAWGLFMEKAIAADRAMPQGSNTAKKGSDAPYGIRSDRAPSEGGQEGDQPQPQSTQERLPSVYQDSNQGQTDYSSSSSEE